MVIFCSQDLGARNAQTPLERRDCVFQQNGKNIKTYNFLKSWLYTSLLKNKNKNIYTNVTAPSAQCSLSNPMHIKNNF